MPPISCRLTEPSDIPGMASIRAQEWGTEEYWTDRISRYLAGELHPQKALDPRISFVALEDSVVIGFVAGHRTRRYDCEGELEWINVLPGHRGRGVAADLLRLLAGWFAEQGAFKVCVNVAPDNIAASRFYRRHGAVELNEYFLVWKDIRAVLEKGSDTMNAMPQ